MGMTQEAGSVVVLSESQALPSLAERLAKPGLRVVWYGSMDALLRGEPVAALEALVVQCREVPNGVLLAALGRLAVEHPGLPKVAVLESMPPLAVASYLTACGVDLVWPESVEAGTDRLATLVERIHEGTKWIALR